MAGKQDPGMDPIFRCRTALASSPSGYPLEIGSPDKTNDPKSERPMDSATEFLFQRVVRRQSDLFFLSCHVGPKL